MYDILPKRTKSFDIKLEGDTTGLEYKGTFTVKCALAVSDQHKVELNRTRMMADYQNPTPGLQRIAAALAELEVRVIDAPAWWKDNGNGYDILDQNIVVEVFIQAMDADRQWRESLKKKAEEAQQEVRPS